MEQHPSRTLTLVRPEQTPQQIPKNGPWGRRCSDCEHAYFGSAGVFCREFNEDIWDEKVAEDCAMFEATPWARNCEGEKHG